MQERGCFLLQTPLGWQLVASGPKGLLQSGVEGGHDLAPEALVEQVEQFVNDHGLSRRRLLIGVGSTTALTGRFEVSSPAELRDRRTLSYHLEDSLPLAAEELVADFLVDHQHVLGVAVAIASLMPWVSALEAGGFPVQSISPVALLALQFHLEQSKVTGQKWILWQDDSAVEFFCCHEGRLVKWLHFAADPAAIARQLAVESLQHSDPLQLVVINASEDLKATLARLDDAEIEHRQTESVIEQATRFATSIVDGTRVPWIELRRESLAAGDPYRAVRRSLHGCLAAAAVLLVVLTAAFWYRGGQYHEQLQQVHAQRVALFHQVFPGSPVPDGVVSRLQSERNNVAGARGAVAKVELPTSAMNVLYNLLSALPDNVRFQIEVCRIEDGRIDLDLQLRSIGDASVMVTALEQHGFDVEPPSTVQESEQVVFAHIHGRVQKPDPAPREARR